MSWKDRVKSWIQIKNPWPKKKQLISIQNQENYQGLSTIDTTFISLPKEKDLSLDEIKRINEYEGEIQIEKQDSLIFYGNALLEHSSRNSDLLLRLFDSVREKALEWQVRDLEIEELLKKRTDVLINYEELEVCQNGLVELRNEAVLRALAIERVQKRNAKKNFRIFSVFRLAEKMKEDMQSNSLSEAKERLLIAIKTIEQQIDIANRMIQEEIDLEYSLRIYRQVASEVENNKYKSANEIAWKKKQDELLKCAKDVGIKVGDIEILNNSVNFCNLSLEAEQNLAREFALLQRKIDIKTIELKRKIPSILNRMQEIEKTPKTKENIYELMKELNNLRETYLKWQRLDRFGGIKKDRDEDIYYQAFYEVILWAKANDIDNFVPSDYVLGYVSIYSSIKHDFYMKVGLEEISRVCEAYHVQYDKFRKQPLSYEFLQYINRYERFLNNKLQQIAQKQGISSFTKQEIEVIRRGTLKEMNKRLLGNTGKAIKSTLEEYKEDDTELPMLELLYELCERDVKDIEVFKMYYPSNFFAENGKKKETSLGKRMPFNVSSEEIMKINSFSYKSELSIRDLIEIIDFLEIQKVIHYAGTDGFLKIVDRIYQEQKEKLEKESIKKENLDKIIFPKSIVAIKSCEGSEAYSKGYSHKYPSKFYSDAKEIYLHSAFQVNSFSVFLLSTRDNWYPEEKQFLPKLKKVHLPKNANLWEHFFQEVIKNKRDCEYEEDFEVT